MCICSFIHFAAQVISNNPHDEYVFLLRNISPVFSCESTDCRRHIYALYLTYRQRLLSVHISVTAISITQFRRHYPMKHSLKQSTRPTAENARKLYDMFRYSGLLQVLTDRHAYLIRLEHDLDKALSKAPEGTLRINRCRNNLQYYIRRSAEESNGTYIPVRQRDLVLQLAQKAYNKKASSMISEEISAIEHFLKDYPDTVIEDLYDMLNPDRQPLVRPLAETDEMFLQRWKDVPEMEGAGFDITSDLYTEKGERVRSKSEVLIANLLYKHDIPYRYEQPLYLDGLDTVYPDFTILNVKRRKEYVWEHCGRMDDPGYAERTVEKITNYGMNGYYPGENLILTFETAGQPLNLKLIAGITEKYLLQ